MEYSFFERFRGNKRSDNSQHIYQTEVAITTRQAGRRVSNTLSAGGLKLRIDLAGFVFRSP